MPTRLTHALGPFTALVLIASGCASSGPYWDQEDQAAARQHEIAERAAGLESQLAAEQERSASLKAEVERLERELARLQASVTPPSSVPPEVLTAPHALAEPRTSMPPGARQEIEQSDLDVLDDPGAPEVVAEADKPRSPESLTAPAMDEAAGNAEAELYERSLALLEQGHLAEAEAGFSRFLAGDPAPELADNALFWLAESALRRADVPAALDGFRTVVERYPEGNKVPDALLKIGFCLAEQGDAESAAMVYRELSERFPGSPAAQTARKRLGLL